MKVTENTDAKLVAIIRNGLSKRNGHCPCRIEETEDTLCICKEFREQIKDPDFEGYCHCRLYYKTR